MPRWFCPVRLENPTRCRCIRAALHAQVALAAATGNVALLTRSKIAERVAEGGWPCEIVADALAAPDAVLVAGRDNQLAEIRRRFAASEGPIVPVLTPDERGAYDWTRLVCERTVTINTTASGGNASLLSLAEEPASLEPRASG